MAKRRPLRQTKTTIRAPESQKSRINEFLEKIGDASVRCGIDENDVCHLIERITGRKE